MALGSETVERETHGAYRRWELETLELGVERSQQVALAGERHGELDLEEQLVV